MFKFTFIFTLLAVLLLAACGEHQNADEANSVSVKKADHVTADEQVKVGERAESLSTSSEVEMDVTKDYHSFSNPSQIAVTHISLDLDVDFSRKVLTGIATLDVKRNVENASELILDTKDLTIHRVSTNGSPVPFELREADSFLGAALAIELPSDAKYVTVEYTSSPGASGLQWLTPTQTAGGKHPFLFSQAQAIHARSFIPLQDTPQARVTYDATLRTPKDLMAVMSASNKLNTVRDGEHHFTMPQAVPSYLIALAVGDLQFKSMGKRTGVYAEPSILEAAATEFADTEAMLIETEKRYGPYSWDRYDLLILPPSFPFGGMENPRLSFITPTVIAGDKSLVSLIAHELAHSWSGNSVTNATWRDLWLNEGFTTYLTYRIMEMIYGVDRYNMEAVLGYQDLEADIQQLKEKDQIMAIDLRGRDPDEVFSNVPYEKGALFLRELEQKVGRDNFDKFLTQYFEKFAFQSITTDQFIAYLESTLITEYADKLDRGRIHQWVFESGIPENPPLAESNAFDLVDSARSQWLSGEISAGDIDTKDWVVHQWLYFLNNLPEQMSTEQLAQLDAAFNLTESKNNEIAHSWLLIGVENWYVPAIARVSEYLVGIGRNKLVKPLYRALSETEEGREFGRAIFEKAKPGYHPLTVKANEGFFE